MLSPYCRLLANIMSAWSHIWTGTHRPLRFFPLFCLTSTQTIFYRSDQVFAVMLRENLWNKFHGAKKRFRFFFCYLFLILQTTAFFFLTSFVWFSFVENITCSLWNNYKFWIKCVRFFFFKHCCFFFINPKPRDYFKCFRNILKI